MKNHTEQEWQFATPDLATVRAWLAAQPRSPDERCLSIKPALQLQDIYYDSADWMIYRAGFALRLRSATDESTGSERFEVTLKSLRAATGGIARRLEISAAVAGSDMSAIVASGDPIAGRIRELVGTRVLRSLFRAQTRREPFELLEAESTLALAEIALDETSIEAPSGTRLGLTRVEVECINAEPGALLPWLERFRDATALHPAGSSKFQTGLEAAGLDPGKRIALGSVEITHSQDFAKTQVAQLRRYFSQLLEIEPRVRAETSGAVHEMRVATRHIEVLLRSWRQRGPAWAVRERRSVRLLIRALGGVRDLEVQIAHIEQSLATLDPADRLSLRLMLDRLEEQRQTQRVRLLHALDSERVRFWMDTWTERLTSETAGETPQLSATGAIASELVREQARKLRKLARQIRPDSDPEAFHEVRIRAKRLRYTLDAFDALYGETGRRFTRALGRLQEILGEFHDAIVREQHYAALAIDARPLPASTYFVMGRLVERDRRAYVRCKKKFPKAYVRIRGRRWRELVALLRSHSQMELR